MKAYNPDIGEFEFKAVDAEDLEFKANTKLDLKACPSCGSANGYEKAYLVEGVHLYCWNCDTKLGEKGE